MSTRVSRLLLGATLLFGAVSSAGAQQVATISGRVTGDGVPIEGANVTIPDLSISVGTNANG